VGQIYLVRHGQASFGAEDYDELSDLGARQSRLLGGWLASLKQPLSCVVTGSPSATARLRMRAWPPCPAR